MNINELTAISTTLLKSNSIEPLSFSLESPATTEEMKQALEYYPDFPKALSDYFTQSNGVTLTWQKEISENYISGSITLSSVSYFMGGYNDEWNENAFEDILWTSDDLDTSKHELLKRLKVLESIEANDTHVSVDLDSENHTIYYHDHEGAHETILQVDNYIEWAFSMLGIRYWQVFFMKEDPAEIGYDTNSLLESYRNIIPAQTLKKLPRNT